MAFLSTKSYTPVFSSSNHPSLDPSIPPLLTRPAICARLVCTLYCWGVKWGKGSSQQCPELSWWQLTPAVHGSPSNNLSVQRRPAQISGGTLERSLHAHSGTDCWRNGLPPGAEKPRVAWKEQQNLEQLLNWWWEEETWILGVQGVGKAEASGSFHPGVSSWYHTWSGVNASLIKLNSW